MRVVDSFDAIRPIMSRFSMLAPLDKDGIRLQVRPCRAAAPELQQKCLWLNRPPSSEASLLLLLARVSRLLACCRDPSLPATQRPARRCARRSRSPSLRVRSSYPHPAPQRPAPRKVWTEPTTALLSICQGARGRRRGGCCARRACSRRCWPSRSGRTAGTARTAWPSSTRFVNVPDPCQMPIFTTQCHITLVVLHFNGLCAGICMLVTWVWVYVLCVTGGGRGAAGERGGPQQLWPARHAAAVCGARRLPLQGVAPVCPP